MTTFAVPRDPALAGALSAAIPLVVPDHDAFSAISEMRNQAAGATVTPATVPWQVRGVIAAALRQVAAGDHPLGEQLRGLADGLEDSAAMRSLNS